MSEEPQAQQEPAAEQRPQPPHPHQHSLLELFEKRSLLEQVKKVVHGMGQPRESGEYKYARLQLLRLQAPLAAVVLPGLVVLSLVFFAGKGAEQTRAVDVAIVIDPEPPEDLEEIEPPEEPLEPPDPIELDFVPELSLGTLAEAPTAAPEDFTPSAVEISAVANIKSPVIMKDVLGRNVAARSAALGAYAGDAAGVTEGAVLKALRWLKKEQKADGSWSGPEGVPPAMTGLALLAFLAHGETPASEEFGPTVERAIRWLVENQDADGRFKGRDGHDYTHPIATYALCEVFGLTQVPMVKDAASRAVAVIIRGQHDNGGWDYNCKQSLRDDTSYMGWCAQALKAARMAGIGTPGIKEAMQKAVGGFKKNAAPDGGFGYTEPGTGGLTGVGVLCLQLLGAREEPEVRKSLAWLNQVTFDWQKPWGSHPIYYWYYITQAKFHASRKEWDAWNKLFALELVKNQVVLPGEGLDGKDIGYWESPSIHEKYGKVYGTTLCTLMLEVYYRYLPTYKDKAVEVDEVTATPEGVDEVEVDIEVGG